MDIRPTSSSASLMRATSWSLGVGADLRDDQTCCVDEEFIEDQDEDEPNNYKLNGKQTSSTSMSSSDGINRINSDCSAKHSQSVDATPGVILSCPKIYVKIPTVFLTKHKDSRISSSPTSSSSFHVYQVNLKTNTDADWSVYKRYSHFLSLHQKLKSIEPAIGKLSFPPKRRLDSKTSTIVQLRRQLLEEYMQKVCDHIVLSPLNRPASSSYRNLVELATNGPISYANIQQEDSSDQSSDIKGTLEDATQAMSNSIRCLLFQFLSKTTDQIDGNESATNF